MRSPGFLVRHHRSKQSTTAASTRPRRWPASSVLPICGCGCIMLTAHPSVHPHHPPNQPQGSESPSSNGAVSCARQHTQHAARVCGMQCSRTIQPSNRHCAAPASDGRSAMVAALASSSRWLLVTTCKARQGGFDESRSSSSSSRFAACGRSKSVSKVLRRTGVHCSADNMMLSSRQQSRKGLVQDKPRTC